MDSITNIVITAVIAALLLTSTRLALKQRGDRDFLKSIINIVLTVAIILAMVVF